MFIHFILIKRVEMIPIINLLRLIILSLINKYLNTVYYFFRIVIYFKVYIYIYQGYRIGVCLVSQPRLIQLYISRKPTNGSPPPVSPPNPLPPTLQTTSPYHHTPHTQQPFIREELIPAGIALTAALLTSADSFLLKFLLFLWIRLKANFNIVFKRIKSLRRFH